MSAKQLDLTNQIMKQIRTGKLRMKPRWYFVVGSFASLMGLVGTLVLLVYSSSLISFSLRTHGPRGVMRWQELVAAFPWWSAGLMIMGIGIGVWLLKQYEFTYKRNFKLILIGLFIAIITAGWLIDYLEINQTRQRRGPMKYHDSPNYPGRRWQN